MSTCAVTLRSTERTELGTQPKSQRNSSWALSVRRRYSTSGSANLSRGVPPWRFGTRHFLTERTPPKASNAIPLPGGPFGPGSVPWTPPRASSMYPISIFLYHPYISLPPTRGEGSSAQGLRPHMADGFTHPSSASPSSRPVNGLAVGPDGTEAQKPQLRIVYSIYHVPI